MASDTKAAAGLSLDEARAIIDRAIAKAAELRCAGAFVVVDEGGNVISISRMDGAPGTAVVTSRAKAYLAGIAGTPTDGFSNRMHANPERFSAYQRLLPENVFPGPGGAPIVKDGRIIGGFSTGPGTGPRRSAPGVDPSKFMMDGQQGNAEDLITAYALQVPYRNQHEGSESG